LKKTNVDIFVAFRWWVEGTSCCLCGRSGVSADGIMGFVSGSKGKGTGEGDYRSSGFKGKDTFPLGVVAGVADGVVEWFCFAG